MGQCVLGGDFANFNVEFEAWTPELKVVSPQTRRRIKEPKRVSQDGGWSGEGGGAFLQNERKKVCVANCSSSVGRRQ